MSVFFPFHFSIRNGYKLLGCRCCCCFSFFLFWAFLRSFGCSLLLVPGSVYHNVVIIESCTFDEIPGVLLGWCPLNKVLHLSLTNVDMTNDVSHRIAGDDWWHSTTRAWWRCSVHVRGWLQELQPPQNLPTSLIHSSAQQRHGKGHDRRHVRVQWPPNHHGTPRLIYLGRRCAELSPLAACHSCAPFPHEH